MGPTSDAEHPEPNEPYLGELALVDPASLIIGVNTRTDVELDPHFCRDIADRGVREPITVRRDPHGQLVVRKGQRRTLAAVKARLTRVRVLIEPGDDTSENTASRVERIVDQYAENYHRAAMTEADEARAQQQLLDLGLSAAQIARKTHVPATRVRAITRVNQSPAARQALEGAEGYALTLDQALVVAEFDDGTAFGDDAAARLHDIAERNPLQFAHTAQALRDQREEHRLITAEAQKLAADGVRVLTSDAEEVEAVELVRLRPNATDPAGSALRPEDHLTCPGHAVLLSADRDWQSDQIVVDADPVCLEPDRHAPLYDYYNPRADQAAPAQPVSEQEQRELKERESAARRRVIANNKAWDSATVTRRNWITELLARKKAPTDANTVIAAIIAAGSYDQSRAMERGHQAAYSLGKLPEPAPRYGGPDPQLVEAARDCSGVKAIQLTLALLLGAYEDGASRDSWRHPTSATVDYFTVLRGWDYPLSDVERLVLEPDTESEAESRAQDIDSCDAAADEPDPENTRPWGLNASGAGRGTPTGRAPPSACAAVGR